MAKRLSTPLRTRGALGDPDNRFLAQRRERVDDGWGSLEESPAALVTEVGIDASRSLISYNDSPDVGLDRSINPYRGCEHGCVYCFARPSHAYLGLSPGLDFETRLFQKPDAPELLRRELGARGYRPAPLMVGINTDAYQPLEARLGLTRRCLEVLLEARHPFAVVTKSALIERDLDLLAEAARYRLVQVIFSITSLQRRLSRTLEPRTAVPRKRLAAMGVLAAAGVPVGVFVAPLIPVLTDHELEAILAAAREAGAGFAGYVLLRLPHETKELFRDWLALHAPLQARHVMNRIRDSRGGKDYEARFGTRMRGTGPYAELIAQRFRLAVGKLGYGEPPPLCCDRFRPPGVDGQLALF